MRIPDTQVFSEYPSYLLSIMKIMAFISKKQEDDEIMKNYLLFCFLCYYMSSCAAADEDDLEKTGNTVMALKTPLYL